MKKIINLRQESYGYFIDLEDGNRFGITLNEGDVQMISPGPAVIPGESIIQISIKEKPEGDCLIVDYSAQGKPDEFPLGVVVDKQAAEVWLHEVNKLYKGI